MKLALMAFYSQKMQWVMDEFAHGILARMVEQGLYSHVDPVKTALPYLAYYGAVRSSNTATTVLRLLRAETFVVALLVVVATGVAAQRLYRSRTFTLLTLFTLLSFSNFLERAFRVRNDSFATLFGVLALTSLLGKREGRMSSYGAGALAGTELQLSTGAAAHTVEARLLTHAASSRQTLSVVLDEIRSRLRERGIVLSTAAPAARPRAQGRDAGGTDDDPPRAPWGHRVGTDR